MTASAPRSGSESTGRVDVSAAASAPGQSGAPRRQHGALGPRPGHQRPEPAGVPFCPTCCHEPHAGHQYDEPRHCDGCEECRRFTNRYRQLERWHRDVDEMLAEMDAEWTMRQTAIALAAPAPRPEVTS